MAKNNNKNKKEDSGREGAFLDKLDLHKDVSHSVAGIFFFAAAIFLALIYFNVAGPVGSYAHGFFKMTFGYGFVLLPITMMAISVVFFRVHKINIYFPTIVGSILFLVSLLGLFEVIVKDSYPGGYVGLAVAFPLQYMFGNLASGVVLLAVFMAGVIIVFNISLKKKMLELLDKDGDESQGENQQSQDSKSGAKELIQLKVVGETIEEIKAKEAQNEKKKPKIEKPSGQSAENFGLLMASTSNDSNYKSPPLDFLGDDEGKPSSGDVKAYSSIIQRTLSTFGIEVEMGEVNVGPTVTQYTLKPAQGIKLSRITALVSDLSLALAAHPIRIEAPVPGKALVGIEIPNKVVATVRLRNLLEDEKIKEEKSTLVVALGRDVSGQPVYADMAKMPHLLIAGSTGSGKSVAVHTILASLIYRNHPKILKFLMIDPKRVELNAYNGIPHLLAPVVVDREKAINALRWAVKEMDKRYETLASEGCRDIVSYNNSILKDKTESKEGGKVEPMPYIVIVVDELADLMMAHGREVEGAIVRLAQLARAVGLHLVISTQRPSVEVITGLIKANISSRIALRVASQVDSRTILDTAGAEKLLGSGDMLFMFTDSTKLRRIQGCFVSEKEIKKVTDFLRSNYVASGVAQEINLESEKPNQGVAVDFNNYGDKEEDELFNDAKEAVIMAKKASATLLQRKLRVGYARAARILDLLEEAGIVGPSNGAAPREVYGTFEDNGTDQTSRIYDI